MVIDNPTTPREELRGFGRITVRLVNLLLLRTRAKARSFWRHTIQRVPTREETVLSEIRERARERREQALWSARSTPPH